MKKIAIIGFGRFGRFLVEILIQHTDVEVLVVSSKPQTSDSPRLKFGNWSELATVQVVIPTVPISAFEDCIKKIAPLISPNTLVIDVCSVKVKPVESMLKHLPESAQILATHPLFGPDSAKQNHGLTGFPIMLFPVRCQAEVFQKIKNWCNDLGLKIIEVTPKQHDQWAAQTHAYAFLIGKIGEKMKLEQTPIDTPSYKLLRDQARFIQQDEHQLFLDIQKQNPFGKQMRQHFKQVVTEIWNELDE